MQLQAHYDPVQDRVLLRRPGASPAEDMALWLTRRQWTAIAIACDRVRTAAESASGERGRPQRHPSATVKAGRSAPPERRLAVANAKLVTGVRFRRAPAGLRIELATDDPAPLVLALRGENLATFADLVARIAASAKWDLEAALARIGSAADASKRVLH